MKQFCLSQAVIVVPDGIDDRIIYREAAMTLRGQIFSRLGYSLAVAAATDAAFTVRFVRGEDPCRCALCLESGVLLLVAASASGLDRVLELFWSAFDENGELTDCFCRARELTLDVGDRSLAHEWGDLRVLYHNIYGYDFKATINPQRRFAFEAYLYREYRPSILCLQEFDRAPRERLLPLLEAAGWAEVEVDYSELGKNCSPIFYDPRRLSLIDRGFHAFHYTSAANPAVCNNANTKNFTWGVFEDQKSGKRLVVISLHLYYAADAVAVKGEYAESNLARIRNAEELLEVIDGEIRTKYPTLPILLGGDFNACWHHACKESIVNSVTGGKTVLDLLAGVEGMASLQGSAELFADDHITCHAFPTYDTELDYYDFCADLSQTSYRGAIDHVYTLGAGLCAKTFDILDNSIAKKCSDHCPIVVDLSFVSTG